MVLATRDGNTANLMADSGMQQARGNPGGESRQGGEKPRRRNVIGQMALLDRRGLRLLGVDTWIESAERRKWTKPMRGGVKPSAVRELWSGAEL